MLSVDRLSVRLPHGDGMAAVVDGISFEVGRGEFVGLVGESGSGKSITARSLIRLLPQGAEQEGSVKLDEIEVLDLSRRELRKLRSSRAAMIFQDPRAHIDPLWRISDHLTEPLKLRGWSRSEAGRRGLELLASVGIADPERCFDAYPDQLSGGMLQRVMIAGALAVEPQLLIADEPTTALDVTTQAEIMGILADLRREQGLTTLFITHDLELASVVCDGILVMYAGTIIESGSAGEVFARQMHPYTHGLLRARPSLTGPVGELEVIPGQPASGLEAPSGCPFAPRCAWARPACAEASRRLVPLSGTRRSACIRIEEIADELD
ncbi:MAG: ABC transporter ATP-binding protein [Actinobacteria bacterium]|nr:ABC transporter ATP-binding protein [Actinomycetota bacterium]MBS1882228.1 ABC transporter ATP-binding protein [Actinomycetota bacterium]